MILRKTFQLSNILILDINEGYSCVSYNIIFFVIKDLFFVTIYGSGFTLLFFFKVFMYIGVKPACTAV